MCTQKYTRTNKPFEATASIFRNDVKVEEDLKITLNKQDMYRHCLERAIAKTAKKEENKFRKEDFFQGAAIRVSLLMDSKPYKEWCEKNGLDVFSTATHIVMKGITAIKRVLCDDIINDGEITLEVSKDYNIPIFTKEELGMEEDSTSDESEAA